MGKGSSHSDEFRCPLMLTSRPLQVKDPRKVPRETSHLEVDGASLGRPQMFHVEHRSQQKSQNSGSFAGVPVGRG